jgi:hypothetical protein
MRIGLAFRAFFKILFNAEVAAAISDVLSGKQLISHGDERAAAPSPARVAESKPAAARPAPTRSEAITLLAALQREARLVDIVKEPLTDYSDAQIGAAARDVLRDCGNVLERFFALRPIEDRQEGATFEVPAGFDAGCIRLTGNVQGEPPFVGTLAHHGWQATRCEVPQWIGSEAAQRIVAPVEVELK